MKELSRIQLVDKKYSGWFMAVITEHGRFVKTISQLYASPKIDKWRE